MNNFVSPISDMFLEELITEIDDDAIRGIVLGGSHARGNPTPYRDVDLACFLPTLSEQCRAVVEHVLRLIEQGG